MRVTISGPRYCSSGGASRRQRAEHEARQRLEPQLARPVLLGPALRRHAALAAEPLAERHAGEVAGKIVAPVVIDADDVARLAALVEHQQRAAMRAAVLERVQRSVLVAGHHDRHGPEVGAAIAVGAGQLGLEAKEIPGRPAKDPRLLLLVEGAVGIDPIRHPREPFLRPAVRDRFHGVLSSIDQSSLTLAALMTLCQRSISSRI